MAEPSIYHQVLQQYWGYQDFRPLQEDIIRSAGEGNDTLGLMPTGGGKSLTFQVPALAHEGICLVVTPLIALMKDQVANLKQRGIKAVAIHSGLTRDELNVALDNCIFGGVKFLYLSPERLGTELFLEKLHHLKVNLLAIDEAHCISQWGYDFRPSYLKVAEVRKEIPDTPVLALTATATPDVVIDIQEKLLFRQKNVFQKSFSRDNLAYVVRYSEDKEKQLVAILSKTKGSAVVYVRSRKKTGEYADLLNKAGVSAKSYHAGMPSEVKDARQKAWTNGSVRVIVSTNAFGMGIDKSDVRVVVHMDAPDSLEAYFQEAGRAGRDGEKAFAVLLWSKNDEIRLKRNIATSFPEKEVIKRVYEALGNFFQVAMGSGFGMIYDFNIAQFCQAYKLNIITVFNSLKILHRAGYLEFTEELEMPSKVHFIVQREELYRFQVANEAFDRFIKLLLRSYTGLFTEYVPINEELLAKRANIDRQLVYQFLNKMNHLKVIKYIPQKKTPLITYLQSREELKYLELSDEVYQNRKDKYEERVYGVIDYATTSHTCRSVLLLTYFGQRSASHCGQCDVCLDRKKTALSVNVFQDIETTIQKILQETPLSYDHLLMRLPEKTEAEVEKVVRWLEEYDVIGENEDGLLVWNRQ